MANGAIKEQNGLRRFMLKCELFFYLVLLSTLFNVTQGIRVVIKHH